MFLSNESIREYQQIFKNHFNEEISFEQARKQGEDLIQLIKILYFDDSISLENASLSCRKRGEKT